MASASGGDRGRGSVGVVVAELLALAPGTVCGIPAVPVPDPEAPRETGVAAVSAAVLPVVPMRDLLIGDAPRWLRVDPEVAARV